MDGSDELVRAIDAKVDALNDSDEVKEMVWTWQSTPLFKGFGIA